MNYYNPYFLNYPYFNSPQKIGLFSKLFGNNISFGGILSGTQKTLNIVNQAIPIIKQASPIINNAKTMFKVMNEFKKVETPVSTNDEIANEITNIQPTYNENNPTFFV